MWEASPQVFGLRVDVEELLPPERFGFGWDLTPGERILALARGLASSPEWQEMEDAVLVVRVQPPYGLAVIGRFTPDQIPRVRRLPAALTSLLPRFRPVTYREVEEDCVLLGERLVETFGRQELHGLAYTGIPRGGLIVLGMLSYVLGLSRERLSQGAAHPGPLVVVDDCALTGRRFGEVLREHPGREVAFAHLYSHPDLRDAIRRRESRVIATPWARDLHGHASDILGPDHEAWVRRWIRNGYGRTRCASWVSWRAAGSWIGGSRRLGGMKSDDERRSGLSPPVPGLGAHRNPRVPTLDLSVGFALSPGGSGGCWGEVSSSAWPPERLSPSFPSGGSWRGSTGLRPGHRIAQAPRPGPRAPFSVVSVLPQPPARSHPIRPCTTSVPSFQILSLVLS